MKTKHDGDCSIYSSLVNKMPEDGICTCGYGHQFRGEGDDSQMYSDELRGKLGQDITLADLNERITRYETLVLTNPENKPPRELYRLGIDITFDLARTILDTKFPDRKGYSVGKLIDKLGEAMEGAGYLTRKEDRT